MTQVEDLGSLEDVSIETIGVAGIVLMAAIVYLGWRLSKGLAEERPRSFYGLGLGLGRLPRRRRRYA